MIARFMFFYKPGVTVRQVSGRRWAQRRRVGMAEHAGERRSSLGLGLGASIASAKGKGRVTGSHRRHGVVEIMAQMCRRRGLAAALGGARGGGCWRGAPGSGTPWIDSVEACGEDTGVRAIQGAPTVSNRHGEASHRRRSWVEIRRRRGSVRGKGARRRSRCSGDRFAGVVGVRGEVGRRAYGGAEERRHGGARRAAC